MGQVYEGPLGQKPPTDDLHKVKYPLTADTAPSKPVPVILGIPWYSNFDRPVKVGKTYFIGRGDLGRVRGGHAICVLPQYLEDTLNWWRFYDQGQEGACVGFSVSRMLSLMNRERYDALELYRQAQKQDEWPGEDYDGTSVRAGCDVARQRGPVQIFGRTRTGPDQKDGIWKNRWALSVDDILSALSREGKQTIPLLNSWGNRYPHIVHMPLETAHRVIFKEDGEAAIPTDL